MFVSKLRATFTVFLSFTDNNASTNSTSGIHGVYIPPCTRACSEPCCPAAAKQQLQPPEMAQSAAGFRPPASHRFTVRRRWERRLSRLSSADGRSIVWTVGRSVGRSSGRSEGRVGLLGGSIVGRSVVLESRKQACFHHKLNDNIFSRNVMTLRQLIV